MTVERQGHMEFIFIKKKIRTPHILHEIFWKYDKQNQVLFITSKETLGNFSDILNKS